MSKLPIPGEYWVNSSGIRYRCVDTNDLGETVWKNEHGAFFLFGDDLMWKHWHHEPLCTGFDWQPPAPIDPGEGWELLPAGTVREREDEFTGDAGKTWKGTKCYGERIPSDSLLTFRRRKPPAEMWPKFVICDTWLVDAYIRRDSETVASGVKSDGKPFRHPYEWSEFEDGLILQGKWRYVTESEALARVKPAEPIAQAVKSKSTLAEARESALKTMAEIEATRCPAEPIADRIPVDEMYLSDKPVYVTACGTCGIGHYLPSGKCDHCNSERIAQSVERTATPLVPAVVESPDDWVEITDPEHVLRKNVDQMSSNGGVWVDVFESHGTLLSRRGGKARCRRRDLPALPAPLPALVPGVATDRMVDLFLSWRLPSDFQPDGGISFTSRPIHESWPTGTNLFTASQARKMIEHLLSVPEEAAPAQPAPQPKRTAVRLWCYRNILKNGQTSTVLARHEALQNTTDFRELFYDGSGFYVEGE